MDECVVERGVDVGHTKHILTVTHLGSQGHLNLLLVLPLSLPWSHGFEDLENLAKLLAIEAKPEKDEGIGKRT